MRMSHVQEEKIDIDQWIWEWTLYLETLEVNCGIVDRRKNEAN